MAPFLWITIKLCWTCPQRLLAQGGGAGNDGVTICSAGLSVESVQQVAVVQE